MPRFVLALIALLCLPLIAADPVEPATKPASRPVPAAWVMGPVARDEANLIMFGDWGDGGKRQREVAKTLGEYVSTSQRRYNGVLSVGDNIYNKIRSSQDYVFQELFEDIYDAKKIPLPFYAVLGNHDYGSGRDKSELGYAAENPSSRFKMPARWYRLDFPEQNPIVTVLLLDSNKSVLPAKLWAEQMEWFKAQLAQPRKSKWLIVGAHHPLYSNGPHGDGLTIQKEWKDLLAQGKVDIYVCGHDHSLQHIQMPGQTTSFVVAGGGGRGRTDMYKEGRGFSRKLYGFTDLHATAQTLEVRFIDGVTGDLVHHFSRSPAGAVEILKTTPSEKAKPPGPPKLAATASPAAHAVAVRGDDYAQMMSVFIMDAADKARVKKAIDARAAAMKKWNDSARGKAYAAAEKELAEATPTGDKDRLARAMAALAPLRAEQEEVRKDLRRKLFKALEEDEIQRWAGHMLFKVVMEQFDENELTNEQQQQAHVICCLLASETIKAADAQSDPYLKPSEELTGKALDAVQRLVLRADQQEGD